ncbi:glycosyl hydrolase family 18 protein [Patescibacteria group bacterium]|nr:glycosyl hydrolase family 18 protein [Patescibacteria group bacterium]
MIRWRLVLKMMVAGLLGYFLGVEAITIIPTWDLPRNHFLYQITGVHKPLVLGYLPYWLLDKSENDYSPYLTDVSYFGLIINHDGTIVKKNGNSSEPGWNRLANGAPRASSLLLQSGVEDSIQQLLQNPVKNANTLMNEVLPIISQYRFRDLTVDVESVKTVSPDVSNNYTQFLKTIKQRLSAQNQEISLSVDVPVYAYSRPTIYNVNDLPLAVDYLVLMTYDYHYRGSATAGPVAPLSGGDTYWENDVSRAVDLALKTMPEEKLILGVPLYGYEWETQSNAAGAAIIPGSGLTASNKRVAEILDNCPNCQVTTDKSSGEKSIVYLDTTTNSYHQIFIGDETTLAKKIELAKQKHLGGIAFWALGYEDNQMLKKLKDYQNFKWISE